MSKLVICKACGKEVAKGAKCPNCGHDQRNFFMKHKIITVILVLVIIGGFGSAMNGDKGTTTASISADSATNSNKGTTATQPVSPVVAPEPVAKDDSIKAGMYKAGTDLQPGEYVVIADDTSGGAYIQLSKDSTGTLESIIANDNVQGRTYVTITSGQYLTIKNAKTYPVAKAPKVAIEGNKLTSGMYKVGVDLQPGEYKASTLDSNGYVEISKSSKHVLEDIVSNDNFTGEKYVTVAAGQYVTLKNVNLLLK